jgi:hypothetical protein
MAIAARLRRWCVAAAASSVAATGCAAPGSEPERSPEVVLSGIGAALHAPVWSYSDDTLLGLTDDHRLAQVSDVRPGASPHTRLSVAPLATGRNIQISQKDHRQVFVPQPERGRVVVVDLTALQPTGAFDAGPAPAYVAEDAGMRVLLALSADGSSVTPVDQYGYRALPTARVGGAPASSIDGANRGREIDYHLYGPSGIRYYTGPSSPPEERGSLALDVAVAAGDDTDAARSYVARPDGNVLYAVGARRGGEGLEVLATAQLPSPIRCLGTDDNRIYAATDHELVTLETESITGYPDRRIPVIHTVDYRTGLPGGPIRSAPLSGMAVGPHRVYLTLQDQPYLVGVAKPEL